VLGHPHALPAIARDGRGPELVVELGGAARLQGAADRGDRDLADAGGRHRVAPQAALVVDLEAGRGAAAEVPDQRREPAPASGAAERALGVDVW
jgi:hypothetical protein